MIYLFLQAVSKEDVPQWVLLIDFLLGFVATLFIFKRLNGKQLPA